MGIPDILHDERVFDINCADIPHCEPIWREKLFIGKYALNEYHCDALTRLYGELHAEGHIKKSLLHIIKMIENGEFDSYEARIKEYYDLMVSKDFSPNTPTLMNAGAKLG